MSTMISRLPWARLKSVLDELKPEAFKSTGDSLKILLADYTKIIESKDTIPSIQLIIGSQIKPEVDKAGKYSFQLTADAILKQVSEGRITWDGTKNTSSISKEEFGGMWNLLKVNPRSSIVPSTYPIMSPQASKYCPAVPLILWAFKNHQGINYSEWDWFEEVEDRAFFLDKEFLEYSEYFSQPEFLTKWTLEELEEFRAASLEVKKAGSSRTRTADNCVTVYNQTNKEFKALPRLMKLALLQFWVFQPHNWNPAKITNIANLDASPNAQYESSEVLQAANITLQRAPKHSW